MALISVCLGTKNILSVMAWANSWSEAIWSRSPVITESGEKGAMQTIYCFPGGTLK